MKPHYTKGVIMIVSNPVDVLVYQCTKWMGLPNGMVLEQAAFWIPLVLPA